MSFVTKLKISELSCTLSRPVIHTIIPDTFTPLLINALFMVLRHPTVRTKKIPEPKLIDPRIPFFILKIFWPPCPRRLRLFVQAGLLTFGSTYLPRLPIRFETASG